MRANHQIDLSRGGPFDDLPLLFSGAETGENRNLEGKLRHPLREGPLVLFGQHGRRHQDGHLVAGVDCLKRAADRQFRLAKTDVAAEQAVHRLGIQHVLLDHGQGSQLVGGFLVGERRVEFLLPLAIVGKRDSRPGTTGRLQFEHFDCQIGDRFLGRLFLPQPGLAADLCQSGRCLAAADVLLHEVDLAHRDVDLCAAVELDSHVLFGAALFVQELESAVAANAVGQVHDQIAFAKLQKTVDRATQLPLRGPGDFLPLEQFQSADQHHLLVHQPKTTRQPTEHELQAAFGYELCLVE